MEKIKAATKPQEETEMHPHFEPVWFVPLVPYLIFWKSLKPISSWLLLSFILGELAWILLTGRDFSADVPIFFTVAFPLWWVARKTGMIGEILNKDENEP